MLESLLCMLSRLQSLGSAPCMFVLAGEHNDVKAEGKGRSVQRPRRRLKFENILTVVPLLFQLVHECVQTHVRRLHKG